MPIVKEFYDSGTLKAKGIKKDEQKEGQWIFYFEDGKIYREVNFRNNIEDGEWKMWHANGLLYLEQVKVLGKSEGYCKEYYENGSIKEIGEYRNGEYFPIDFWNEEGRQLLKNGSGKKIEKFGYLESDIFEHYFENGIFIREVKVSSTGFRGFSSK
jgi:antitoxin component YwqK of YwqJK toxin-antitoxin module